MTDHRDSLAPRVSIVGPTQARGTIDGVEFALRELVEALTMRGWDVDYDGVERAESIGGATPLTAGQRWLPLVHLWEWLPVPVRRVLQGLCLTAPTLTAYAHQLQRIESHVRAMRPSDVVIVCADGSVPGTVALVTSLHPTVIVLSLQRLAEELSAWWWPLLRMLARVRFGNRCHPALFRRPSPAHLSAVVFASRAWQLAGLRAGVPPAAARTIYFGGPRWSSTPCRGHRPLRRLLWVGRLSREKGLHLLIDALPAIRSRLGHDVQVTAVAAQGPPAYRRAILARLEARGVQDAVTILPPCTRERLRDIYCSHDLLFFDSAFDEPVALVIMEAFASLLPVVGPARPTPGALLREGETCTSYRPGDATSVARAIVAVASDPAEAARRAIDAATIVSSELTWDRAGASWHALLSDMTAATGKRPGDDSPSRFAGA